MVINNINLHQITQCPWWQLWTMVLARHTPPPSPHLTETTCQHPSLWRHWLELAKIIQLLWPKLSVVAAAHTYGHVKSAMPATRPVQTAMSWHRGGVLATRHTSSKVHIIHDNDSAKGANKVAAVILASHCHRCCLNRRTKMTHNVAHEGDYGKEAWCMVMPATPQAWTVLNWHWGGTRKRCTKRMHGWMMWVWRKPGWVTI